VSQRIINQTRKTVLAEQAMLADTVFSRLKGLLGRKDLGAHEALVITHCRSIHMFFMRFAIDVVFIDKTHRVVGTVKNIKPFQMSPYFFRAVAAIELPVGRIQETQTERGDILKISE